MHTEKTIRQIIRQILQEWSPEVEGLGDGIYIEEDEMMEIMKGYLYAALWTEEERLQGEYKGEQSETDDEESDINKIIKIQADLNKKPFEGFMFEDLEPNSKIQAYLDIKQFIKLAGANAISEVLEEKGAAHLGHDFWLTRNGHGAGFFDHNFDFEKNLMDAAHALKGVDLYLTDNATLAFSNAH